MNSNETENPRNGHCSISLFKKLLTRLIHPGRLTWNIIMEVWKIIFLSKWLISRFHVNLPGYSLFRNSWVTKTVAFSLQQCYRPTHKVPGQQFSKGCDKGNRGERLRHDLSNFFKWPWSGSLWLVHVWLHSCKLTQPWKSTMLMVFARKDGDFQGEYCSAQQIHHGGNCLLNKYPITSTGQYQDPVRQRINSSWGFWNPWKPGEMYEPFL